MSQTLLEELETRNKFLENELQTLRDLFQNLNNEKDLENPDQRRSFMLKAQVYQLERQCMLLSQAQSNRAAVLIETESQLQNIMSSFQTIVSDLKPGPDVIIKRAQVMTYLGNLRKLKNSLYKQSKLESSDSLRIPSLMSGSKFLKSHKPIDCIDLFNANSGNLNMKCIADLEQELSSLRKKLYSLNQLLQSHCFIDDIQGADIAKYLFSPWIKKMNAESKNCVAALEHCSDQLLALSFLHPSAPWNKCKIADDFESLKFDKIIKSLPSSLQKNTSLRSTVTEICQAHDYVTQYQNEHINLLRKQLKYQKAVQAIQSQYLLKFSSKLLSDYQSWKNTVVDGICKPVSGLLQSWKKLKDDHRDVHLKQFLANFKTYESELERLCSFESLDSSDKLLTALNTHLAKSLTSVAAEYDAEIARIDPSLQYPRPAT